MEPAPQLLPSSVATAYSAASNPHLAQLPTVALSYLGTVARDAARAPRPLQAVPSKQHRHPDRLHRSAAGGKGMGLSRQAGVGRGVGVHTTCGAACWVRSLPQATGNLKHCSPRRGIFAVAAPPWVTASTRLACRLLLMWRTRGPLHPLPGARPGPGLCAPQPRCPAGVAAGWQPPCGDTVGPFSAGICRHGPTSNSQKPACASSSAVAEW